MSNREKRILVVSINSSLKGGAEGVLLQIATYFMEEGYDVHVLFVRRNIPNEWKERCSENCTYHYLSVKSLLLLAKLRFDKTFTSHPMTTGIIGAMRKMHLVRMDSFIGREPHALTENKGVRKIVRALYRKLGYSALDLLVCQTEWMKETFIRYNPKSKIRVKVIPNPILIGKEIGIITLPTTRPYVVAAGRFIPEKGFDILVKAFSRLRQESKALVLVILGDGKLRKEMESLVKGLKLEDDVILCGFVDNVYPFFKQAKMCVVSSRVEGFPNVLLQEMSQNEKVVSTLCAGDIDKLQGVFTCKPNDEDDLLRAMQECLKADTSCNRELFDKELQSRSVNGFMDKVVSYLEGNKE
jgi:glycosyltransferase involved in cell wall biosynthesis